MESIEQPFDSILHQGSDLSDTNDKSGLIETTRTKRFTNGDSPRAESSPLHQAKSTNSILHGPQNYGLRVIIISSIVFALAVTIALILTIYLEPNQVHGHAAVSTEDVRCSNIGLQMLERGGNSVDAAVASAFCLGVVNPAHSGIGGGGFAIVYDHTRKKLKGYNFREKTPAIALPFPVGVPGFVKGLAQMHKNHGKLKWKDLLQPAVDLAYNGFSVSQELARALQTTDISYFMKSGSIFLDGNTFKTINDTVVWRALAVTLRQLQDDPDSLYSGDLLLDFLKDIQDTNSSTITEQDMRNYTAQEQDPLKTRFKELTVLSLPPPAGGALIALMLNMIDKLDWKETQRMDSMTYHQLIEVYKFAYAHKTRLGDQAFNPGMQNITAQLTSPEFAADLVKKIGNKTLENYTDDGSIFYPSSSTGMSHISVIDSSELMVSLTLSLNSEFGSKILLPNTGIWLNSALMDFGTSSANEVEPGKRPQSSMSPTVLYNEEHPCSHRMIIGASNGEKILTGIVETVVNSVIFKKNLADAISAPRIHDQLVPNETLYEDGIPAQVITDLAQQGHNMRLWRVSEDSSMVTGAEKSNDDIIAFSDERKFGKAAQY